MWSVVIWIMALVIIGVNIYFVIDKVVSQCMCVVCAFVHVNYISHNNISSDLLYTYFPESAKAYKNMMMKHDDDESTVLVES